jgi:hypothetical protein
MQHQELVAGEALEDMPTMVALKRKLVRNRQRTLLQTGQGRELLCVTEGIEARYR